MPLLCSLQVCALTHRLCRCPHCQHFAPTYDKVGAFFNTAPEPQPRVVIARVDCADEVRSHRLDTDQLHQVARGA